MTTSSSSTDEEKSPSTLQITTRYILPLLIASNILIAATVIVGFTFYLRRELPPSFMIGISLSLAVLGLLELVGVLFRRRMKRGRCGQGGKEGDGVEARLTGGRRRRASSWPGRQQRRTRGDFTEDAGFGDEGDGGFGCRGNQCCVNTFCYRRTDRSRRPTFELNAEDIGSTWDPSLSRTAPPQPPQAHPQSSSRGDRPEYQPYSFQADRGTPRPDSMIAPEMAPQQLRRPRRTFSQRDPRREIISESKL